MTGTDIGPGEFLGDDMSFENVRFGAVAVSLRYCAGCVTVFDEFMLPCYCLGSGRTALVGWWRLVSMRHQERAYFLAESLVFGTLCQVHSVFPLYPACMLANKRKRGCAVSLRKRTLL